MALTATSPMTNNNINIESKALHPFQQKWEAEFGEHQKEGVVTKRVRISALYNKIIMAPWEITNPHARVGRQADLSITVCLSFSC
jgi:hypothetical protein